MQRRSEFIELQAVDMNMGLNFSNSYHFYALQVSYLSYIALTKTFLPIFMTKKDEITAVIF